MVDVEDDDDSSLEERQKKDQAVLKLHALQLGEHFESVTIIVTRNNPRAKLTMLASEGVGNWYARYGSVREWMLKTDERTRQEVRAEGDD